MVDTVGRKLTLAREKRGLSLEEAAMQTRVRSSQLAALEADDYSSFGSNTYTRGFLLIYGKFLGVEVGEDRRASSRATTPSASPTINISTPSRMKTIARCARPRGTKEQEFADRAQPRQKMERRRPSFAP